MSKSLILCDWFILLMRHNPLKTQIWEIYPSKLRPTSDGWRRLQKVGWTGEVANLIFVVDNFSDWTQKIAYFSFLGIFMYLLVFLGDNFISKFVVSVKKHRKNYETALFIKVWIITRPEGRSQEVGLWRFHRLLVQIWIQKHNYFLCECIDNTQQWWWWHCTGLESTIAMIITRWIMLRCTQGCNDIKCNNNATTKGSWKMKSNIMHCKRNANNDANISTSISVRKFI